MSSQGRKKSSADERKWAELELDKDGVPVLPGRGCCSKVKHNFEHKTLGIVHKYRDQQNKEPPLRCVLMWECRKNMLNIMQERGELDERQKQEFEVLKQRLDKIERDKQLMRNVVPHWPPRRGEYDGNYSSGQRRNNVSSSGSSKTGMKVPEARREVYPEHLSGETPKTDERRKKSYEDAQLHGPDPAAMDQDHWVSAARDWRIDLGIERFFKANQPQSFRFERRSKPPTEVVEGEDCLTHGEWHRYVYNPDKETWKDSTGSRGVVLRDRLQQMIHKRRQENNQLKYRNELLMQTLTMAHVELEKYSVELGRIQDTEQIGVQLTDFSHVENSEAVGAFNHLQQGQALSETAYAGYDQQQNEFPVQFEQFKP